MDNTSLISYPSMLPELEKVIPKPLKKRYRDLFEEDGNPSSVDLQNIPSTKLGTFAAFANASHHIPVKKENINYQQLHRPSNLYRKSVIKRSITKHISIIDIEQIPPKLTNNLNALNKLQSHHLHHHNETMLGARDKKANFEIDYSCEKLDEKQKSRIMYLSKNYIVNSSVKLKVKWREKYENFGDISEMANELKLNSPEANFAPLKSTEKKTVAGSKYGFNRKESAGLKVTNDYEDENPVVQFSSSSSSSSSSPSSSSSSAAHDTILEDRMKNTVKDKIAAEEQETANGMSIKPIVRKLERARKGLIYQKFMAATYTWSRKEKTNTKTCTPSEPRKRGRPRTIRDDNVKRAKNTEFDLKEPSVTLVKIDSEKTNNGMIVKRKYKKRIKKISSDW